MHPQEVHATGVLRARGSYVVDSDSCKSSINVSSQNQRLAQVTVAQSMNGQYLLWYPSKWLSDYDPLPMQPNGTPSLSDEGNAWRATAFRIPGLWSLDP